MWLFQKNSIVSVQLHPKGAAPTLSYMGVCIYIYIYMHNNFLPYCIMLVQMKINLEAISNSFDYTISKFTRETTLIGQ